MIKLIKKIAVGYRKISAKLFKDLGHFYYY